MCAQATDRTRPLRGFWPQACLDDRHQQHPTLSSQVCRMQNCLPSKLPGCGEEGLSPLCPPAQVPGTEHCQLTLLS